MPSGSDGPSAVSLALTASVTTREFSPMSMSVTPTATSPTPSLVAAPLRISEPISTSATSAIRTGTPPRVATIDE